MFLPPFVGPHLKIERGQKHISDLRAVLIDYIKRNPCGFVETGNHKDGQDEFEFRFEDFPTEIPLLIGDAAHNLRSALDLLMCDIARHLGKSTDKIKFPFAATADELEHKLTGVRGVRRLGPDITNIIRDLKPYKGGNLALRALHDLDVMDKHDTVLPVFQVMVSGGTGIKPAGAPMMMGIETRSYWQHGSTVWVRRGDIFKLVQQGPIQAVLPPPLPIARKPVVKTFENLAKLTTDIVARFSTYLGVGAAPPPTDPV